MGCEKNSRFRFVLSLVALLVIECSAPNVMRLKETPRDKEKLKNIDLKHANFENAHVVVLTNASSSLGRAYKDAINSATHKLMIQMGGVTLVDRAHTNLALNEAIFQKSGLVEIPKIQMGKIKGASHLITSGLTHASASQEYYPEETTCNRQGKCNTRRPFWKNIVEVSVRINAIDLQTSEILIDEDISNKYTKSTTNRLDGGSLLQLLPSALAYCFEDAKPLLQKVFPIKGMIIAMKGDKEVAMISLGSQNKILKDRIFDVVNKIKQKTAVGIKTFYDKIGKCKVFQVESDSSWCSLGGDTDIIKIGMEVHARPEEVSFFRKFIRFFKQN